MPEPSLPGRPIRDPQTLGEVLPRVLDSLRPPDTRRGSSPTMSAVGGVFGRWAEVVGEAVATHVTPLKADGDVLVVQVDEPAWATQLKFLEEGLLERLATETGARFERLDIRVKGASGRGRRGPRNSV